MFVRITRRAPDGEEAQLPALKIFFFGGMRLARGDVSLPVFPTHKAASLFAYLVTHRRRAHARDVLAGTLWGDLADAQARRNLSTTLWRVRRTLGHDYILTGEESVAFNTHSDYWLDAAAFEERIAEALEKRGNEETLSTPLLESLSAAVDLYCGEFLEGFGDDWCLLERERLRALYLEALQGLVASHTARGDYQAALRPALLLTRHDPLREQAHRDVMRLQLLLGRRNAALQQYHLCRQLLQDELGQEPCRKRRPCITRYNTRLRLAPRRRPSLTS